MTEITYRSDMKVELLDHMGSDETVARAARVSTGKDQLDQGKIEGLIGYLVRESHTSVLEHCVLTFRMEVPIFVHRQLMTHRTISKNSESGRYTEFKPEFYVPSPERPLVNAGTSARPELVHGEFENGRHTFTVNCHKQAILRGWEEYTSMVNADVANEVARNVLPVSTYTSLWMTGNLLAWFNFLRLRNGSEGHPQYEIVEVARQVEEVIAEKLPITYAAWKKTL